jgi:hypothetical protein
MDLTEPAGRATEWSQRRGRFAQLVVPRPDAENTQPYLAVPVDPYAD